MKNAMVAGLPASIDQHCATFLSQFIRQDRVSAPCAANWIYYHFFLFQKMKAESELKLKERQHVQDEQLHAERLISIRI
jgi:hypothetical protein